jgi:hypothetical protein
MRYLREKRRRTRHPCAIEPLESRLLLARTLYVDINSQGATQDGASWSSAYRDLQLALSAAIAGDQIHVADGVYKPSIGSAGPTFSLKNGVALMGGYAGFGSANPDSRDVVGMPTILSGDVGAPGVSADNAFHVVTGSGTDATAILDGFTITAGSTINVSPDDSGGGMYNVAGSPTIRNCTFTSNWAVMRGGAMYNENASPTLIGCTFNGNTAAGVGGGGIFNFNSSPQLTNCVFVGNLATGQFTTSGGAAMYNSGNSSPALRNCTFRGNKAASYGGAMFNSYSSSPTLTNCVFAGNIATSGGGGAIYNFNASSPVAWNCIFVANFTHGYGGAMNSDSSSPRLTNCTFTANMAGSGAAIADVDDAVTTLTNCIIWSDANQSYGNPIYRPTTLATYCDIQGGYAGAGNVNVDPRFPRLASPGTDGIWGTIDDDYGDQRLWPYSPVVDAGSNSSASTLSIDLDGNPRFANVPTMPDTGSGAGAIIDMGAYEAVPALAATAGGPYAVIAGQSISLRALASSDAAGALAYAWDFNGDGQFDDAAGQSASFPTAGLTRSTAVISVRVTDGSGRSTIAAGSVSILPQIVYVDENAHGGGDGSSWAAAATDLAQVMGQAIPGEVVRVAQGIYKPTATLDATAAFHLNDGVQVYGGYAGGASATPDARDTATYRTILSGALGGPGAADDSLFAIVASQCGSTTLLDGFAIESGDVSHASQQGGMRIIGGSPTVRNCVFTGNNVAMFVDGASPVVVNCLFLANSGSFGAALYLQGGSPVVADSTFVANRATSASGGAIYNNGSTLTLSNSIVWGNSPLDTNSPSGTLDINYCDMQFHYSGTGDINIDPLFVRAPTAGTDGVWNTWDDDYGDTRLQPTSPAVDVGLTAGIPAGTSTDLAGNPRVVDVPGIGGAAVVDMGAYETQSPVVASAGGPYFAPQGLSVILKGAGSSNASGALQYAWDFNGDGLFDDATGPNPTFSTAGLPLGARQISLRITDSLSRTDVSVAVMNVSPPVLYVDGRVTGGRHDGLDWANAFTSIADALAVANRGMRIDVARGVYKPTSTLDRTLSFNLKSGVSLYGGYAGFGAANPDARDFISTPTVLSGDIGAAGDNSDNSLHVVKAGSVDATTMFDGFTITGGANPNGTSNNDFGAGMFISGSMFVSNCTFQGNVGSDGGALSLAGGSPTIVNSVFVGNSAKHGGAVTIVNGFPVLINCTFVDNSATTAAGAVEITSSPGPNVSLTNCIFWGNTAPMDPQIGRYNGTLTVSFSDVQGGYTGTGNINSSPWFLRNPSPGADATWGTADDDLGDLRAQPFSPVVDAGINAVPEAITTDILGNPRFNDIPTTPDTGSGTAPLVDMGAFEAVTANVAVTDGPYWVLQGKSITLNAFGAGTAAGPLQFAWEWNGDGQFDDASGANPVFNATGLVAATRTLQLRVTDAASRVAIATTTITIVPAVVYVDASATGNNDGTSWANAYTQLGSALTAAVAGIAGQQIRVAGGVYKPTDGIDRDATFQLKTSVSLQGGYGGLQAANPDARDVGAYPSILSGDIGKLSDNSDNSFHVINGSGTDATAVLDGFTITQGNAAGSVDTLRDSGGGIYINTGSPSLSNCLLVNNHADYGGGLYLFAASPPIINVTFLNNSGSAGGGLYDTNSGIPLALTNCVFIGNAAPITSPNNSAFGSGGGIYSLAALNLTGCTFTRNSAALNGGGVFGFGKGTLANCAFYGNSAQSGGGVSAANNSLILIDCAFTGNFASQSGGAANASSFTLTNCTFSANSAVVSGGAVYVSSVTMIGCILWGNLAPSGPQFLQTGGNVAITYSDIQGGATGTGNVNANPLFLRTPSAGPDAAWGTIDDDYGDLRLGAFSPGLDAGNSQAIPANVTTDLSGGPRFKDIPTLSDTGHGPFPIVDMGAYEADPVIAAAITGSYTVAQGRTITLAALGEGTASPLQFAWEWTGDGKFDDGVGPNPVFNATGLPPGTRTVQVRVTDAASLSAIASSTITIVPAVIYVDAGATGNNDGTSWANAYTHLTPALAAVLAGIAGQQVRVAGGIYKPTEGLDRNATFALKNLVALQGGYAGSQAANPDLRDLSAYPTVLSGDIGVPGDNSDNSFHIVTGTSGITSGTLVDGFTLTAGNGDRGGGVFLTSASPSISNCIFTGNFASTGGGAVANVGSSPIITNCTFNQNGSGSEGGAILDASSSSPSITSCTFTANSAAFGGAIVNSGSSAPTISKCSFIRNMAGSGGAVENYTAATPKFLNCIFQGNSASANGGAIFNTASTFTNLVNCLLVGNTATSAGGAIENTASSNASFINCTIAFNSASSGGGLDISASAPRITNCIVYGNSPAAQIAQISSAAPVVTFSDIQGGFSGNGNINANPLFLRNASRGPDNAWGTLDDDYGELHLRIDSPCIDAASNAGIPSGTSTDLDGNVRTYDVPLVHDPSAIVDMGAFEAQPLRPTIAGTAGNDSFYVNVSPDQALVQIWPSSSPLGTPALSYALAFFSGGTFSTGAGNDSLTIDLSSGRMPFFSYADTGQLALILNGPGPYAINTDVSPTAPNLTLSLAGGAAVSVASSQHLAGLSLADASTLTLASGHNKHLSVGALDMTGSSRLDLADNGLIVRYAATSPESGIQQYVNAWRANAAGPMLLASKYNDLSSRFVRTLAVFDNHDAHFTSLAGEVFAPGDYNQVLARFTYVGDANVDGRVDPTDYAIVDGNQGKGHNWVTGDMNFDGKVDPTDYAQIDGNQGAGYGGGGGPQLSLLTPEPGGTPSTSQPPSPQAPATVSPPEPPPPASPPALAIPIFSTTPIVDKSDLAALLQSDPSVL